MVVLPDVGDGFAEVGGLLVWVVENPGLAGAGLEVGAGCGLEAVEVAYYYAEVVLGWVSEGCGREMARGKLQNRGRHVVLRRGTAGLRRRQRRRGQMLIVSAQTFLLQFVRRAKHAYRFSTTAEGGRDARARAG